jgi:hypothetical protein
MRVVVVVPFFSPVGRSCLQAVAGLAGITRLGLVTHAPLEQVPHDLRAHVQHYQIRDCLNPSQLGAAVAAFHQDWGGVDRLVGYLEQMQEPLAAVRAWLNIDGMSEPVARNFREKNRMKEVLRRAGLPVARQALLTDRASAQRFVQRVGYPIVVKPPAGAGSRSTLRVSEDAELSGALEQLFVSPSNPAQAEEFVQGAEHSFETVFINGEPVWQSSSYYLPGPLTVIENPWMQYCVLLPREMPEVAQRFQPTNLAALRALGLRTALTHMEWFRRGDGSTVVSEVAARPPGVQLMPLMSHAHEVDFWAKWAELMVFDRWSIPERKWATGVAFFRGQGRGRVVSAVHGLEAAQAAAGDAVVDRKLPRVGQLRADTYEGEGWAIVRHRTTQGAVEALKALVSNVKVELG